MAAGAAAEPFTPLLRVPARVEAQQSVGTARCYNREYRGRMVTMSVRLPKALSSELEAEAARRRTSKSSVARMCLEEGLRKRRARRARPSCLSLVVDLAGAFAGPADLSTNPAYLDELHPQGRVLTTDSHFRVYRRNRRQIVPVLLPPGL